MRKAAPIAFLLSLIATPALAATIDFRSSEFSDANYQHQLEYAASDGVVVTVTPEPQPDATLYWDSRDGLGVRYSYEDDEIEGPESLTIEFSESVYLTEVSLTDLFNESGYLEQGAYSINGGPEVAFSAEGNQRPFWSNGQSTLSIGEEVTSISFSAPGRTSGGNHEFSVAGLSYETREVPELDGGSAASALSLLIGGVLLASARRRRRT